MRTRTRRLALLAALCAAAIAALVAAPTASAASAWWGITQNAQPTYLAPGGEGDLAIKATNRGYANVEASASHKVTITDKLPPGLEIASVKPVICKLNTEKEVAPNLPVCGRKFPDRLSVVAFPPCTHTTTEAKCTFEETLAPYETWEMGIQVKVEAGASPGKVSNTVSVDSEAAGVGNAEQTRSVAISNEPVPFGVDTYNLEPEDENGKPATQAGSHPFQFTTELTLNQIMYTFPSGQTFPSVPAQPRNVHVNLPPGLVGTANKQIVPQCTELQFTTVLNNNESNQCPENTAVGVSTVTLTEPSLLKTQTFTVPVYNLVPFEGEPARFGFMASDVPVTIDTEVREGDYHIVANVNNVSQLVAFLTSNVTIWGVPGDPKHDLSRGSQCVAREKLANQGEKCTLLNEAKPEPFITLPTSCSESLQTSVKVRSWIQGAAFVEPATTPLVEETMANCSALPFEPKMAVEPTEHTANTPTGLNVTLKVPQPSTHDVNGLAESAIRDTTVVLPKGVQLSPSAANGLAACTTAQIGYTGRNPRTRTDEFSSKPAECPDAAKVGTVEINSPLLENPLNGNVYLAAQEDNPFHSLFGIYIVVADKKTGVLVKLAGKVDLDKVTGQITNTFPNAPQLPFEELKLSLFNGPRASIATPRTCGTFSTETTFVPWSGGAALNAALNPEQWAVTSGPGGVPCATPQQLALGFAAGTTNTTAGGFTPFTLTMSRGDYDQQPTGLTVTLPPGIAGYLSSVDQCPEPAASEGTCPESSLIGHATAIAGLGPQPFTVTGGKVYVTGPYGGAPFGLSIVIPAKAGPFDFGIVVTRSTINVDRNTAQLTVGSVLPTMLNTTTHETGAPVQLRRVEVSVDRPSFQFNATNCSPFAINGTITGDEGGSQAVSSHYQATGCENLPFGPVFEAEVGANFTRLNGTFLKVMVKAKPGEANIKKTKIVFPEELPSRLTTIQKACRDTVFEVNPANCPEGSVIGSGVAHTPVLKNPLVGPAYLVSHGNAAFPDAEFVLQGENGLTLVLDGQTDIKHGITSSTFQSVPDAPISTFEVNLPAGPHSAFTGFGDLCKPTNTVKKKVTVTVKRKHKKVKVKKTVSVKVAKKLVLPTELIGQNENKIEETLPLKVAGCKAVKSFKKKKAPAKKKKKKKKKK
jgi:hypothetical protein